MCANYVPVTRGDWMLSFFGVERDFRTEVPPDVYPTGLAPFIRLAQDGSGNKRIAEIGRFGLLPGFAKELAYGRHTYNARSETVHTKPSFRDAWRRGQRCIVPAEALYEERYHEDLTHERWMVQQPGGVPFGIAGIYDSWRGPDGREENSFAMLTVNADAHVFYRQFHAPGDEKRMPVILSPEDYDAWLACPVAEAARYFRAWAGEMIASARPRPAKPPRAVSGKVIVPKATQPPAPPPPQGSLF